MAFFKKLSEQDKLAEVSTKSVEQVQKHTGGTKRNTLLRGCSKDCLQLLKYVYLFTYFITLC